MTLIDFSSNNNIRDVLDVLTPTQFSYLGNICVREVNLQGSHIGFIEKGSFSAMKYIDVPMCRIRCFLNCISETWF
jgi:hypothetical protein